MKFRVVLLLFLVAAASARAATTTSPADVLATVGSATITRGELDALFTLSPPELRKKGMRHYLGELVKFRLLLETAKKKGYESNPAVQARLRPRTRETLARLVFEEEKKKLGPVTEAELKSVYEARKSLMIEPESLDLSELIGSSEADAAGFRFVAQRTKGGVDGLGDKLKSRVRHHPRIFPGMIPADKYYALQKLGPGGYSEPMQTGKHWSVFYVRAINPEREKSFEEMKDALRKALEAERDEKALRTLMEACGSRFAVKQYPEKLSDPDSMTVIAEVGETKIRRQELLEELERYDRVMRDYFTQEQGRKQLLERIAQRECLAQEALARKELMARHQTQLDYARDRELVETLVNEECYSRLQLDDAEGQRYYRENLGKFGREQVLSSHILFAKKSPDRMERAEEALSRIRAGEDFHALAKELSEDPGTQPKGGDLGWFGRNFLVQPYEQAAFSMQEGQITSRPVESMYGVHLIKVEGLRKAIPYEQVREAVMKELTEKRRSEAYDAFVERARKELGAKVSPESLPPDPEPERDPRMLGVQRITITSSGTIEVHPAGK